MPEVAANGLVDQRGAVGEKEDALLHAALPQAVDDLESGVSLAGARRHDEEVAVVAFVAGDGFDRAVDGDLLVVAWRAVRAVGEIILRDDGLDLIGDAFECFVFLPELLGRRESIERDFRFDGP